MQQVDDYVNYVVSVPDGGQEEYRKDRSTRGIVTRSRQNKHLRARSFEDLFRNSRRGEASVKGQLAQTRSANTRLFSISGREHAWKVKQMIDGSTASSFPPILKIVQYLSIFATFQTRLSSIIPLLYTLFTLYDRNSNDKFQRASLTSRYVLFFRVALILSPYVS